MLRRSARCTQCGGKGATIQIPEWGADANAGVAERLSIGVKPDSLNQTANAVLKQRLQT
jgi:hypothetical protein